MAYRYGDAQDEVDKFFEYKRSWSQVKDRIVSDYVNCYLNTVPRLNKPIVLVDSFSGPGRFGDGTDGSPLLICKAITDRLGSNAPMSCIFADTRIAHRTALSENLRPYIEAGLCGAPFGSCDEAIAHAIDRFRTSTVFFYLDPYGIKDLDFEMVRQIYERNPRQSTEVLINFNFRTFMRMSGNWGYDEDASTVAAKVKGAKVETVNRAMCGDYWKEIVTDVSLNKLDREDAVMQAYLGQVRKFFRFAYAIPVKERTPDQMDVPVDELAHYHLIFGTRSPKAVEYMNDVALNALEPYLRSFREGLLFDLTPDRYQPADRDIVKAAIIDAVTGRPLKRPEIYEVVIPKFFLSYKRKEYRAMVDELVLSEGRLFADPSTIKRKGMLNDDTLISVRPWT
jgi:three-Cys-motif partner protein